MVLPTHKLVARGISMSPEGRGVFANLTVRENLQMGAYLNKNKRAVAADMQRAFKMFPRLKEREAQKGRNSIGRRTANVGHGPRADVKPATPVTR